MTLAFDGSFSSPGIRIKVVVPVPGKRRPVARLKVMWLGQGAQPRYKTLAEADERETDTVFSDPDLVAKRNDRIACWDRKKALYERLEASSETQMSEVAPDARSFRHKSGQSGGGYNGPIAVDDQNKLIVAVDRVQETHAHNPLEPMMTKAQEALKSKKVLGLADQGDANHRHIKGYEDQGMAISVPWPKVTPKGSGNRYVKDALTDEGAKDHSLCLAGRKRVHKRAVSTIAGKRSLMYQSRTQVCRACPVS